MKPRALARPQRFRGFREAPPAPHPRHFEVEQDDIGGRVPELRYGALSAARGVGDGKGLVAFDHALEDRADG